MKLPFLASFSLCQHFLSLPGFAQEKSPVEPIRILHVMSYHSPWRWTDGQFDGFKAGLGDVPAEYRVLLTASSFRRNLASTVLQRSLQVGFFDFQ